MTGPMIALCIILGLLAALLITLLCLLLFGSVGIRIVCREKLRVVASVCGIKYTILSDKEPKKKEPKNLSKCRNPEAVLKKELRRRQKAAERAEKKRRKAAKKAAKRKEEHAAQKPVATPNLKEKLDMILALLQKLYRETRGKVRIHIRQMRISVGAEDAAKTAILYGIILQSASYLLNFIETSFTHIKRSDGSMVIEPDYLSGKCSAEIDIACSVKIRRAIPIGIRMLQAFRKEKATAYKKAAIRHKRSLQKKAEKAVKKQNRLNKNK